MSKISAIIYLVKDKHGNQDYAITDDSTEIIDIGLPDIWFEGKAYNLKSWCEENSLKYKEVRKDFEFDSLWNE